MKKAIICKATNINIRINPEVKKKTKHFGIILKFLSLIQSIFLDNLLIQGEFSFVIKQPKYNKKREVNVRNAQHLAGQNPSNEI